MEDIKVSILCLVYNHEKYLRKCLDGFVMQQCDFEYEVLIHDDASTDNSAEIIKEYEQKYPNIIKPIYQTENQHSKGIKITKTYQKPRIKGEYIAWCEGDDFWIDPLKLQKQVKFLDNNPEYSACLHRSTVFDLSSKKSYFIPDIKNDREYTLEEIVKGGGSLFSTNSIVLRSKLYLDMPECFVAKGFGDYQLYLYSAICGKVLCLADNMSQYNYGTTGSWTERVWNNPKNRIAFLTEQIRMLKAVNEYYEYKYTQVFEYKINESEFQIHLTNNDKESMKLKKYRYFWRGYKRSLLVQKFPFLKKIASMLKRT